MKINPQLLALTNPTKIDSAASPGNMKRGEALDSFGEILNKALDEVNELQNQAADLSVGFAAGAVEDIHQVMIASEKAGLALQFTIQIRNKILDAYHEIMRMQV